MFKFNSKTDSIGDLSKNFNGLGFWGQQTILHSNLFGDKQKDFLKKQAEGAGAMAKPFSSVSAKIMTVTAALLALKAVWDKLNDENGFTYKAQMENVEEAREGYQKTADEIAELTQQAEHYKESINEIADAHDIDLSNFSDLNQMIEELEKTDSLSLMEQAEIDKIKAANQELETQIRLKQELATQESRKTANEILELLDKNQSKYHASKETPVNIKGDNYTTAYTTGTTDLFSAIETNLKALEQYKTERQTLLTDDNVTQEMLDANDKQIQMVEETLAEQIGDVQSLKASLEDENGQLLDSVKNIPGITDSYSEMIELMREYTYRDLPDSAKKLAIVNDYFDGSSRKNRIKEKLLEIIDETDGVLDVQDAFHKMGMAFDSTGMDASTLTTYIRELKDALEEADEAADEFSIDGSFDGVMKALESEDSDSKWEKLADAYGKDDEGVADLIKNKKWGTDDVQSFIEFLSPGKITVPAGENTAIAFQKAYKDNKVKQKAQRYFNADKPLQSAINAQNDLIKAELGERAGDGSISWENLKSSVEAAKAFDMSVEAAEVLLHNLESYGHEFEGVFFAQEGLTDYESYVTTLQELYDTMAEGSNKERLKGLLEGEEGWEANLAKYKEDLTGLTEDQVIRLEFETNLAEIQNEIDALNSQREYNGGRFQSKNAETNAEITLANEEHLKKQKEGLGLDKEGIEIPAQLKASDDSIDDLIQQLGKYEIGDDNYLEVQAKIENQQELQKELLQLFADEHPEINAETDTGEIEKALTDFFSKPQHLKVDSELTGSDLQAQFATLTKGSTITFKAVTDDGSFADVEAKLNEDGTITYSANMDGVDQEVQVYKHETGVLTLTSENNTQKGIDDANDSVDKGLKKNPRVTITVDNTIANNKIKSTTNLLTSLDKKEAHTYLTVHKSTVNEPPRFLGTARASGTAYANGVRNDIPYNVFDDDRYKTTKGETALTGELGRELVVTGNRWFTVGDHGAEFANIPKGSIVFNHKQTEELLSKGSTSSRGRALASGTAYYKSNIGLDLGYTSSSSASKNATAKTKSKSTKQANKALDAIADWFDWIEVRLDRLARDSENAEKAIERAVGLSKTLSATNKAITAVNKEQDAAEKGAKKYLAKAKEVAKNTGLSVSLQKKVQNGTIDITKYSETTQKKINEYQKYYEKYLDCLDKVADLEDQAIDLALSRLDKITEYYDSIEDVKQSLIDINDAKLDYREAVGYSAVSDAQKSLLQSSLNEAKAIQANANAKYTQYQNEFNAQVKAGTLKEGSVEYNERLAELNNLKAAYYEASTSVLEHADALREVEYTKLQQAIDTFARASEKIANHIDLLESRDEKASESMYVNQIQANNGQIDKQYNLRQKKLAEQATYAVGSIRYQELAEEIAGIDGEIINLLKDNEALKDSIVELRYDPLVESVEGLQDVRSEIEDFMDLLNEEAFFDSDTGALTGEGVANIYLIEQAMNSAKQEIAEYTKGLEKLDEDLNNGNISQKEFNEKNSEYREGIRNAIKDVKSYSDTLSDLYITQMEKENELLQEVIDKRKEALKRKEDYYNYDKTLRNQTKDLNLLKAQAAALEGSNDAASQAQLKRLKQQIADAEEELQETKRSHSVEMQEQGYDALSKDLSDVLADTELEIKTNAEKQLAVIDSMLQQTVNKYAEAYGKINDIIANTGFVGSGEFNNKVSENTNAQAQKDLAMQAQSNTSATTPVKDIDTSKIATTDTSNIESVISKPEQTTNRPVNKIELSHSSVSVQEGNTIAVKATISPSDAKNQNVTWKSSDTQVATVSGGTIKGVKPGSCIITATAADGSGVSATVSVNVTALPKPAAPVTSTSTTPATSTTKTSTSTSTSSGSDGKVTKGEKVTFASGKYTASSDGSGASGKQKLGKSVYIAKVKSGAKRPYLLSTDKAGKHLLGWVKKSQLKGYASGSKYIDEEQFAWTQEQGSEIITLPDGSVLTKLPKGAGVIPHNLTENLWGLANSADDIMANTVGKTMKLINNVVNNGGNTVNYHYDSLLTVNGDVDKAVLPELKEILKQSYQYTTQQMTKDALKGGNKLRR